VDPVWCLSLLLGLWGALLATASRPVAHFVLLRHRPGRASARARDSLRRAYPGAESRLALAMGR